MNTELGWLSLLPSLLAILFAIITRKVVLALLGGVLLAHVLLFMPSLGTGVISGVSSLGEVLIDPSNQLIWGFTLAIGALFGVLERGGTFRHFVAALQQKQLVPNKRRARMFTWILGVLVFIESNVSIMTSGTTSRPVYDQLGISRQKLAYLIDSTCAPICILIPLNAWGAFNIGLIGNQGINDPISTFVASIGLNFYAIIALFLALFVAWTGWAFGPMKGFEQQASSNHVQKPMAKVNNEMVNKGALYTVIISLVTMVLMVPVMLYITGEGRIVSGDGMVSVFTAIMVALGIAIAGTVWSLGASSKVILSAILRGAWKILPLAIILWVAIALGDATRTLGSGEYLAGILNASLPIWLLSLIHI